MFPVPQAPLAPSRFRQFGSPAGPKSRATKQTKNCLSVGTTAGSVKFLKMAIYLRVNILFMSSIGFFITNLKPETG